MLVCALDIVGFKDFCYLCVGGTPFCFAHWMSLASRSVVARRRHIAFSFCALKIIRYAIFRTSAIGGAPVCVNNKRLANARNIQFTRTKSGRPVECVNYKKNAKKKNKCAEVYGDMPPKTDK